MARGKRGRGPPLSYEQKYKQIKRSKWNSVIDIQAPTDRVTKSAITRYHKRLFTKKGWPTSFNSTFEPYKGKHVNEVRRTFRTPRGAPRIGPVIEKGSTIAKFTKEYVDVRTKYTTERRYKFNRKALLRNAPKELKRVLSKARDKSFQIYVGGNILKDEYKSVDDAIRGFREFARKYKGRKDRIGIVTVDANGPQRSNGAYRNMIRRGKKS